MNIKPSDKLKWIAAVIMITSAAASVVAYAYNAASLLQTDFEAYKAAQYNLAARDEIVSDHESDRVTHDAGHRNERIDRLDKEIRELDEAMLYDQSLTEPAKEYKRNMRTDLVRKQECIRKGSC
jgi:hypothetical protein